MYYVKYGNEYLHDPRTNDRRLIDLKLDAEENSASKCEFTIYSDHPLYSSLILRDFSNEVVVLDDEYEMFRGYIYEIGKEFYLNKEIKCKGELAYLNDTLIRPYSTLSTEKTELTAPDGAGKFFEWVLSQHNSQVGSKQRFYPGYNYVDLLDTYGNFYSSNEDPTSTGEILVNELIDTYGGVVQVRRENDIRYLDYYTEWDNVNAQILDFGVNLLDYKQTDSADSIITYVIPRGATMSNTDYGYNDGYFKTSDKTPVKGKQYYTCGYTECDSMIKFTSGVTYYRKVTKYFKTKDTSPISGKSYYWYDSSSSSDNKYTALDKNANFSKSKTYYEAYDKYYKATEKTPVVKVDYYTLTNHRYNACSNLTSFAPSGVTYYEYDEYADESNEHLSINDYPDGPLDSTGNYIKQNDMIYSSDAETAYGVIGGVYKNTDLTTREELVSYGLLYLKKYISPTTTIEIKAIDLALINKDYKTIRVGDYVRVRSKPHNFDSYMLCTEISLDLNNPENSEYTLGETFDTLTGESNKKIKSLNSKINTVYEKATAISADALAKADEAFAKKAIVKAQTLWYVSTSDTELIGGEWVTEQPIQGDE